MAKEKVSLGNPLGFGVIFGGLKLVAGVLKSLGILEILEEKAAATETEIDDKAIKIAKAILEIMGK